jgi:hypothetical protein
VLTSCVYQSGRSERTKKGNENKKKKQRSDGIGWLQQGIGELNHVYAVTLSFIKDRFHDA